MLTGDYIDRLLADTMPSFQLTSSADRNLGFGHILYGITRAMRPRKIVAIGSKAGFAPICLAKGLADNLGFRITRIDCPEVTTEEPRGSLNFVDPGYAMGVDDAHFHGVGYQMDWMGHVGSYRSPA